MPGAVRGARVSAIRVSLRLSPAAVHWQIGALVQVSFKSLAPVRVIFKSRVTGNRQIQLEFMHQWHASSMSHSSSSESFAASVTFQVAAAGCHPS